MELNNLFWELPNRVTPTSSLRNWIVRRLTKHQIANNLPIVTKDFQLMAKLSKISPMRCNMILEGRAVAVDTAEAVQKWMENDYEIS
tara:strand:- start:2678 stop:2938 length:261 start_codon:yes stop_codon:yes gene_type:complete